MERHPLTPEERQQVQRLIHQLADRHPGGWDGLMREAEIPSTTAHGWRYGQSPATPSSRYLLRILRAAGILGQDFRLPEPREHLAEAAKAAKKAGGAARAAERRARDARERDA